MTKFISREQLYTQVWTEPFTKLGPKHNVSPTDLRKLCQKFLIPIPVQGHWQRIAFGKKIEMPPLKSYTCFTLRLKKKKVLLKTKETTPAITVKSKVSTPIIKYKINVKHSLMNPHPIIARTRDSLKSQKTNDYGLLWAGGDCVDIRISPANYKHVLRVLDALFKWFEKHGYTIVSSNSYYGTYIEIDGERVQIAVDEKSKVTKTTLVDNGYWTHTEREYTPSNKVSLLIKSYTWRGNLRRTWSAGKLYTLEEVLPMFIDGIFVFATKMKEERLQREKEAREQKEARRQKKYKVQCEELEQKMIARLENEVKNWHLSMQLKSYILAVEEKAKIQEGEILSPETIAWIEWANIHLDEIDPLRGSLPSYAKAEDVLKMEDII